MKQANFFAFEGIDGSGKSTQIKLLAEHIKKHTGTPPILTQEPTKSPLGKVLRQILTKELQADPRVISSLFATDRLYHILNDQTDTPETGLLKTLQNGTTVLTDRYYFSSYAYHTVDQPLSKIIEENAQNASLLKPTATIFLDISPKIAMSRINTNRQTQDLYESESNLTKVSENYKKAFAHLEKEETVLIFNANQPESHLSEEIWNKIKEFF